MKNFSILDYLDTLIPDGGSETKTEKSFFCPLCGAKNFKVNLRTEKYSSFGCSCALTKAGKRRIVQALLPLTWKKPPRSKQKRTWTYRTLKGKPIIKVHRIDDGEGGRDLWQESLIPGKQPKDLEPHTAPYRFDECLKVLEQGAPYILWVEGEPCADACWQLGIPATTTIRGCGAYRPGVHQGVFPPEKVIVCPDQDTKGMKYANAVAADYPEAQWLYANPTSYLWQRLPASNGFDIADWIANGATAETILSAIEPRRPLQPDTPFRPDELAEMSLADACHRLEALALEGIAHSNVQLEIFRLAEQTGRQPRELENLYQAIQQERDTAAVSAVDQADFDSLVKATQDNYDVSRLLPTLASTIKQYARAFNQPAVAFCLPLLSVAGSLLNPETNLAIGGSTDYRLPPIFWGGLVADPGSIKTPIFNLALKPLQLLQGSAYDQYQLEKVDYNDALKEYRSDSAQEEEPKPPKLKQYYCDNSTVEKIQRIVTEQTQKGLAIAPDELSGFFHGFNQYKGGKGNDRDFWKSAADGGAVKVDRVSEETRFAAKTSIGVTGTIQPEVLKELMGSGDADGFWSRFLWVRLPLRRLPAPDDGLKIDLTSWLHSTYQRLEQVPAKSFRLSREARATWRRWHEWIEDKRLGTEIPVERVLYPKYRDRAGRVALIAHCLEAASQGVEASEEISNETLEAAISFTTFCLNQTRLLYADMGLSSELTGHLLRTWQFIEEKGLSEITPSDLQRSKRIKIGPKDYAKTSYCRELLEKLVGLGRLTKSGKTFSKVETLPIVESKVESLFNSQNPLSESDWGDEKPKIEKLKEGGFSPGRDLDSSGHSAPTEVKPISETESLSTVESEVEKAFNFQTPFSESVSSDEDAKIEKLKGGGFSQNHNPPANGDSPPIEVEPLSDRELAQLLGGERL